MPGVALLIAACGGGDASPEAGAAGQPVAPGPPTLGVQRVFPALSFTAPVALLQAPGDGARWFVVEQGGTVRVFANAPQTAAFTTFVDISARVAVLDEMGLLGMAFHPAFPANPRVYLSYNNEDAGRVSRISEFMLGLDGNLDPATERILLSVDQPETNHKGGQVAFGADGYLYVGLGDVGQNAVEEIDRVSLGGNYGWRCREGTRATGLDCGSEPLLLAPIAEYGRSEGSAVTGGYVYRGTAVAGLAGRYVFGDFGSGRLWHIAGDTQPTAVMTGGFASGLHISSFGEDVAGELYVVDYGGGIYRLVGI